MRIEVRFKAGAPSQTYSGRLFVMLRRRADREPRFGPAWFNPGPFFAIDVQDVRNGDTITLDDQADAFPAPLAELPPGVYYAQAVFALENDRPLAGNAPGNFHGPVQRLDLRQPEAATRSPVLLDIDRTLPEPRRVNTAWAREIRLPSRRLSTFHRRPVEHRATVILPPSYWDNPKRRYPTIYIVPGFGGSHLSRQWELLSGPRTPGRRQMEFVRVLLNGQCAWGHHAFADSATNGPHGEAFMHEIVPLVENEFRVSKRPATRLLTGHSSGGWAALWMQLQHPDQFGGVWSLAPDPVDFRDFQGIDLYADPPENMYTDRNGERRVLARRGGRPAIWYDDFCRMDECLKRGGQMRSFEAVFSPLDEQGLPRKLWDRATGRIDSTTVDAWRRYDIRRHLERHWETLGDQLAGKLHISVGGRDTFFLESSVRRLQTTLRTLGSDASIEIVRRRDHVTILSPERVNRNVRQMTRLVLEHRRRSRAVLQ